MPEHPLPPKTDDNQKSYIRQIKDDETKTPQERLDELSNWILE
jgi:hypothetical protein